MLKILALSLLVTALYDTPQVFAYEDTYSLGADAFYAQNVDPAIRHAPGVALFAGLGVDDIFSARLRLSYQWWTNNVHHTELRAEWLYVVDILSIVPRIGVGTFGAAQVDDGKATFFGGLGAVALIDYLLDREQIVGLDIRADWRFDDEIKGQTSWSIGVRYERLFEIDG